jgi:hypothetical protein
VGSTFLAVCPAIHMLPGDGVTPDGYWAGPVRQSYVAAEADMPAHGHDEAFVAMCALDSGLCGPVTR